VPDRRSGQGYWEGRRPLQKQVRRLRTNRNNVISVGKRKRGDGFSNALSNQFSARFVGVSISACGEVPVVVDDVEGRRHVRRPGTKVQQMEPSSWSSC
jgi:hypothetical protein